MLLSVKSNVVRTVYPERMPEAVDHLLTRLLTELEERPQVRTLADQAGLSRTHAIRAFRQRFGETPGQLRRRLILERAAWSLLTTDRSVTDLAFDLGYGSLEGFTRAFGRAYGQSPSLFRRSHLQGYRLPGISGLHFHPGQVQFTKEFGMDILSHLLWFDEQFLQQALTLLAAQPDPLLDQPLDHLPAGLEPPTLRALLDQHVFTKEVWVAAVQGGELPSQQRDRSLSGLRERLQNAFPAFQEIALDVQQSGRWAEPFEDALCEPAELFPYGGMIAHVLSTDGYWRQLLSGALAQVGLQLSADPMHFSMASAPMPALEAEHEPVG